MEALPSTKAHLTTPLAKFYALLLTQTFSLIGSRMTSVAGTAAWQRFTPVLGNGPAAAIGLVQVATGLILLAGVALTFSFRPVRHLEAELPSYEIEVAG